MEDESTLDPGVVDLFRRVSKLSSGLVAALGTVVLLGWALDVPHLKSVHPSLASMKANTALLFVFLGVGFGMTGVERLHRMRLILGALVAGIATLTALQDIVHIHVGLDEILVRDTATVAPAAPGRMSPGTSLSFFLLGLALLLDSGVGKRSRLARALIVLAGANAFLALCGYLYDITSLYKIYPYSSMALHTALGFLVACLAGLSAHPADGLMALASSNTHSGTLLRRLVPAVVLLPTVLGWLVLRGERAGLYDANFGVALLVLTNVVGLGAVTWFIVTSLYQSEIQRKHTEQALQQSAARLHLLAQTAHEFSSITNDVQGLLDLVARRLSESVGELCTARLISKDGQRLDTGVAVWHPDPEMLNVAREVLITPPQRVGEGISGKVAATGSAIRIPHITTAQVVAQTAPRHRALIERLGMSTVLVVPLKTRNGVIGVISMSRSQPNHPYTMDDQHLAQDLADRAALAIENAMLLADLEDRVARRTAALQEANRELEAFSYSVSHDLRAPLRAIDGFSQIVLEDHAEKLDEQGRSNLKRVVAAAQRMSALIDDLLNLSRITRTQVNLKPVLLTDIARSVAEDLRTRQPSRSVSIDIADELTACADPQLITIVIENLLGNAWKFTANRADAQIVVGKETRGDETVFFVRDNGAGFNMQYAGKLFTPFQRLHRSSEFEGTGIGLATVERIVKRHGGRIWAEGAVDKGATFFFTLGNSSP